MPPTYTVSDYCIDNKKQYLWFVWCHNLTKERTTFVDLCVILWKGTGAFFANISLIQSIVNSRSIKLEIYGT